MRGFQKVAVECPKSLSAAPRRAAPATGRRGPSPRRRRRRVEDARRDEVDYLPENGVYCLRCFWWGCFHNPVSYRKSPPDATLNFHPFANAVSEWDANERDGIDRTKDELIEDAKSIYEEYGKLFNGGSMK